MQLPNPQRLAILIELRERVGLTQDDMARLCGLDSRQRQQTAGTWERGQAIPRRRLRDQFIYYLWDGLRLRREPQRFLDVWQILVEEWGWEPIEHEEWRRKFANVPRPGAEGGPNVDRDLEGIDTTLSRLENLLQSTKTSETRLANRPVFYGIGELPPYYVHRHAEFTRLYEALVKREGVALTALQGMGGVGKTTLARAAALDPRCTAQYPDGVLWGQLGPDAVDESAADMVLLEWGLALKLENLVTLRTPHAKARALAHYLQARQFLLVIDDVWHSTPAKLLQQARGERCGLLITTRSATVAAALELLPLQLDVLQPDEAVALFSARCGRTLSDADTEQARELAARLGYHPLAVQLAAAQFSLPGRSWSTLLEPLRRRQPQPFALLELDKESRDTSLEICFDLSYRGLSAADKQCYYYLGILAPEEPFALAALEAMARQDDPAAHPDSVHPSLFRLLDAGLLTAVPTARETRFQTHELVYRHAERKLSELAQAQIEALRDSHSRYYGVFLQERQSRLDGKAQQATLNEIAAEIGNLRIGWQWLVAQGKAEALEAYIEPLSRFYEMRSWHEEGQAVFGAAFESFKFGENSPMIELVRAQLLMHQGMFCIRLSNYQNARRLLEDSLAMLQRNDGGFAIGFVLSQLGAVRYNQGEYQAAQQYHEESLALLTKAADWRSRRFSLSGLGLIANGLGNYEIAKGYYAESLQLCEEHEDLWGTASALNDLGTVLYESGSHQAAEQCYRRSLKIQKELGNSRGIAMALNNLGLVYLEQGAVPAAQQHYLESLQICRRIGHQDGITAALDNLGEAALLQGDYEKAKAYHLDCLAITRQIGSARGKLFALNFLGNVYLAMNDDQAAYQSYGEALGIAMELGAIPRALESVTGLANFLWKAGRVEQAAACLTFVIHHPACEQTTCNHATQLITAMMPKRASAGLEPMPPIAHKKGLEQLVKLIFSELSALSIA